MSYLARICTAILLYGAGCKVGGRAVAPIDRGPPDAKVIARVDPSGFAPAIDPVVASESPGVAAIGPRAPTLVSESAQPFVHFARPMKADATALQFELDP